MDAPTANTFPRPAGFLLLLVAVVAAYWRVHTAGFIWDDDDYVTQNLTLLSWEGLWRIWAEPGAVPQYYPLVHTTFWLEYRLWGLWAGGYHAVNVLLHALSAMLLWRLLARLGVRGALFAAALWALHPVMVESVAWITERKNCLSMVLALAALHAAVGAWRMAEEEPAFRVDWRPWLLGTLLLVGALLSKTVTGSLPAVVLVLLWWRHGRVTLRESLWTLPWFALSIGLGAVTIWMEKVHVGAEGVDFDLSLVERLVIAGRACWFYAGKLVLPLDLAFIYPRWDVADPGALDLLWPAAAIALPLLLLALSRRIGRGPATAVLLFGGILFPALGFIDVYPFLFSFVADHFQYHASAALCALAGAGGAMMAGRLRIEGAMAAALAVAVLLPLGALTHRQTAIYQGMEPLWRDTLARNPDSWMPMSNLALELDRQGRLDEAVALYRRAAELRPEDPVSRYNTGTALLKQGDVDAAVAEFRAALALREDYPLAWFNLGVALSKSDPPAAVDALRQGLRHAPDDLSAHRILAQLLAGQDPRAAEGHLRRALAIAPRDATSFFQLAAFLQASGPPREAAELYRQGLELRNDPAMRVNRANALAASGQLDDAIVEYRAALGSLGDDADTRYNLATVLVRAGRNQEAAAEFREVLRLNPNDRDARAALGRLGE